MKIEKGIDNINKVVEHYAKTYKKEGMILLDSSGSFSECISMSIIVKHLIQLMPSAALLWGMEHRYYHLWEPFTKDKAGGSVIFPLPNEASKEERTAWREHAKTLGLADVQFPGLGITRPDVGFIKNFILNAGLTKLLVPTIPMFPHEISDFQWHDQLAIKHGMAGKPYIAIEYNKDFEEKLSMIARKATNAVWIGNDKVNKDLKTINATGCNFRQSKVIVQRAKAFIACSEDYKNLSICGGIMTKTLDINSDSPLSVLGQANTLCH